MLRDRLMTFCILPFAGCISLCVTFREPGRHNTVAERLPLRLRHLTSARNAEAKIQVSSPGCGAGTQQQQ